MFPRRVCSRCRRSISVKRDGATRGHFCPHYRSCEPGRCPACQSAPEADWQPDVLDATAHPEIGFSSTSVEPAAGGGWKVSGRLTLHGQTGEVSFSVVNQQGRYRGAIRVKQRDFGIVPVSLAGGAVKVKDELLIVFDIAVR